MPFLHLGYKKIHYSDYTPSGHVRETFILMHGLGSSQNYYDAVAHKLQTHHFRCITFDTTGAGRSPYTQIEQSVDSLSDDVIGILDALDVSKAIVVGHSMGGMIAANLAAQRTDRVVAAILIGPIHPSKTISDLFQKRIEVVEKHGMGPLADSIPSTATAKTASPLVKAFIRELLYSQDPAGYCSNCRVIANAVPPDYSKIDVPVLILAGDEDKAAPLEGCREIFEAIGTGEKKLEVMERVGHWHCLEAYEEVEKLVRAFYHEIQ